MVKPCTMNVASVVVPLWAFIALSYGPSPTSALTIAYCSSQNTGSSYSPNESTFQSNGLCEQTCSSDYAFAILQGKNCWCSNYIPADQSSVSDCSNPCPGYPSDTCGSDSLFGYIAMSGHKASGTATASGSKSTASSTTTSSSSDTESTTTITGSRPVPETQTVTVTDSASASQSSTTSKTAFLTSASSSTTEPPTTTSPIVSVHTVAGQPVTITISNPPAATSHPSVSTQKSSSSLSGGAIAGIVIGSLLGVGALATLGLWFWFFGRRRDRKTSPSPDSHYDPSISNTLLDNRRRSKASQMSLMRNLFAPSEQEKPPVSPTDHLNPNSNHAFTDNRMKKDAMLYPNGNRHSTVSLQDNQDYSRPVLRLTNPD